MRTSRAFLSLSLLALLFGTPALASTIESFSSIDAIVTFDISPSALAVTVQNLRTVDATGNTLTAIRFAFEPGAAPLSLDLTSVDASQYYGCEGHGGSTTCGTVSAPLPAPLYGWAVDSASPEFMLHPAGGLKPGAIVNDTIVANAGDGLGEVHHNPYLGGPVTFVLSGALPAGAVLDSDSIEVHFGTAETGWTPVDVDPTPEPATSLLVGLVLIGLGWHRTRTS